MTKADTKRPTRAPSATSRMRLIAESSGVPLLKAGTNNTMMAEIGTTFMPGRSAA